MIIGLHGKLGSGKDTALERLQVISPLFVRHSFADKLKDSACALLGIDRETVEELKRDDTVYLAWLNDDQSQSFHGEELTMRSFLQRYGTESHRDVFGQTFWVDQAMAPARASEARGNIATFSDCRFLNEAEAVLDAGGEVWHILGPEGETGDHPSEVVLPPGLITRTIDNTNRADNFVSLDAQLAPLVEALP